MSQLARPGGLIGGGSIPAASAPFSPTDLGASLLAWWTADDATTITQSGGAVSSWKDKVAAYDAAQATGAAQPIYSATGWNGAAPGITFDGVDDCLTLASQPFPNSTESSRLWALVDQTALVADATARYICAYGGDTAATQRRMLRRVSAGANIVSAQINTTSADGPGNFSGRHVVEAVFFSTGGRCALDGTLGSSSAIVPATGTTRFRIGATANLAASAFFQGVLRTILVTTALTAGQEAQLTSYLLALA